MLPPIEGGYSSAVHDDRGVAGSSTRAQARVRELAVQSIVEGCARERMARAERTRTRPAGELMEYAPGSAVVEMVEAVLKAKKKILPCSVFLQGEYGVQDLFVGVPCKLGANGLEEIIEITLTPDEDAALQKSAEAVRELVEIINV